MSGVKIPRGWRLVAPDEPENGRDWYCDTTEQFPKWMMLKEGSANPIEGWGVELKPDKYGTIYFTIRRVSDKACEYPNFANEPKPKKPKRPFGCKCWTWDGCNWIRNEGEELVIDSDTKCIVCGKERK